MRDYTNFERCNGEPCCVFAERICADNYKELLEKLKKYGFKDVELKLYHKTRIFNAYDYISLLNTYSDHRTMNLAIKARFEEEIKEAILEHNNLLKVYDTIELYLARK